MACPPPEVLSIPAPVQLGGRKQQQGGQQHPSQGRAPGHAADAPGRQAVHVLVQPKIGLYPGQAVVNQAQQQVEHPAQQGELLQIRHSQHRTEQEESREQAQQRQGGPVEKGLDGALVLLCQAYPDSEQAHNRHQRRAAGVAKKEPAQGAEAQGAGKELPQGREALDGIVAEGSGHGKEDAPPESGIGGEGDRGEGKGQQGKGRCREDGGQEAAVEAGADAEGAGKGFHGKAPL